MKITRSFDSANRNECPNIPVCKLCEAQGGLVNFKVESVEDDKVLMTAECDICGVLNLVTTKITEIE